MVYKWGGVLLLSLLIHPPFVLSMSAARSLAWSVCGARGGAGSWDVQGIYVQVSMGMARSTQADFRFDLFIMFVGGCMNYCFIQSELDDDTDIQYVPLKIDRCCSEAISLLCSSWCNAKAHSHTPTCIGRMKTGEWDDICGVLHPALGGAHLLDLKQSCSNAHLTHSTRGNTET